MIIKRWLDLIKEYILRLNKKEFVTYDLYLFYSELKMHYPNNHHIKEAIRLMLQKLRDQGFIDFLGRGHYRVR